MNIFEQLKMTGELMIIKTNIDGIITDKRHIPNLVVTTGKTHIISRMLGAVDAVMSHMGIGAGVDAPTVANTALQSALGSRVAISSATQLNNTVTYIASFGAGVSTGALTEAGIFNNASTGSMLCRTTFPVVTKEAGDSIAITWSVTIS